LKNSDHTHYIRLARQHYNDAILNRNVEAICSFFAADYHVVTGRGIQSDGIEEQRHRWAAVFQADPIVLYRRHTRELRLSDPLGNAEELGNWVGKYTLNQNFFLAAGVYAAKWQRQVSGIWLIQTEVFTTLRSKGYEV
jgi:hypothetical protein